MLSAPHAGAGARGLLVEAMCTRHAGCPVASVALIASTMCGEVRFLGREEGIRVAADAGQVAHHVLGRVTGTGSTCIARGLEIAAADTLADIGACLLKRGRVCRAAHADAVPGSRLVRAHATPATHSVYTGESGTAHTLGEGEQACICGRRAWRGTQRALEPCAVVVMVHGARLDVGARPRRLIARWDARHIRAGAGTRAGTRGRVRRGDT